MKLMKIYLGLALLGLPVSFFNLSIGFGWTIGHLVMAGLTFTRAVFYDMLLSMEKFSMAKYFSYIIFTVGMIALPLGVSFIYPNILNPYAIFVAYFLDRALHFVFNLFTKEETHAN